MIRSALLLLLLAAGCGPLPRDPDGTLERVRAERSFRVGVIAPGDDLADREKVDRFLAHLSEATGARPLIDTGPADTLLNRLEQGRIDLVVGHFVRPTPWAQRVSLSPPFAWQARDIGTVELAAAARNGENAWIEAIHRAARRTSAEAAAEAAR